MPDDANEAVRLKEQKDAERGFDAESDEAHPSGGGDSESAPSTSEGAVDPAEAALEDGNTLADKIMPSSDKPRPAHE